MIKFRDFRNPLNRIRIRRKLWVFAVIASSVLCCVSSSGDVDSLAGAGEGRSISSSNVISTNFGVLKNNTFRNASKKFGKWASLTTSTTTTTSSTTTSETPRSERTTRATSRPTTTPTRRSTTSRGSMSTSTSGSTTSDYLREFEFESRRVPSNNLQNSSSSLSSYDFARRLNAQENEEDLMVPDQIMSGSDTFMNVVEAPITSSSTSTESPSTTSPSSKMERRMDEEGQEEEEEDQPEMLPQPQAQVSFPKSFQKFGVQDSLIYKNNKNDGGQGQLRSQGQSQSQKPQPRIGGSGFENVNSGGPSVGFTNRRDFGFTIQPPKVNFPATGHGHGNHGQTLQFQNAPVLSPQPISGGGYINPNYFPSGGLHEINPFSNGQPSAHPTSNGNSNPNIRSFSPYSHNPNPTIQSRPTHRPSLVSPLTPTPQRSQGARSFGFNYFPSSLPTPASASASSMSQMSQSHHPVPLSFSSSHMETWSPSSYPQPVYRGPTRRSDYNHNHNQNHNNHHNNDLQNEITPSSSRTPEIQGFMPISPLKPSQPLPLEDEDSPEIVKGSNSNSHGGSNGNGNGNNNGGDEGFLGSFDAGDLPEVRSPSTSSPPPEESTIVPVLRPMGHGQSEQSQEMNDQSPENSPSQIQDGGFQENYENREDHENDIRNQIHSPPSSAEQEHDQGHQDHELQDSPLSAINLNSLPLNEHNILPIPDNQPHFQPSQIDAFPTTPSSVSSHHRNHNSHHHSPSPSFGGLEESPKQFGGFSPSSAPQTQGHSQNQGQGFNGFGKFPHEQTQSHSQGQGQEGFLGHHFSAGNNDLGFQSVSQTSSQNSQMEQLTLDQFNQNQRAANGFLSFGNPFDSQRNNNGGNNARPQPQSLSQSQSISNGFGPGPSFNSPFLPQPQALQGFGFADGITSNGQTNGAQGFGFANDNENNGQSQSQGAQGQGFGFSGGNSHSINNGQSNGNGAQGFFSDGDSNNGQGFGFSNSNGQAGDSNTNGQGGFGFSGSNFGTLSPPKGFPAFGPPASNPNPPSSSDENANIEMEPQGQMDANSLEAPPTSTFHFNNHGNGIPPSPQAFFSSAISEERSGLPVGDVEGSVEAEGKKRRQRGRGQVTTQAPGYQQFGNFPGRNADIILKPMDSQSQGRFRGSKSLGNGFHEIEGSSSAEHPSVQQMPSNMLNIQHSPQSSSFSTVSHSSSFQDFGATAPASQNVLPDAGSGFIGNAPSQLNGGIGGGQQFLGGGGGGQISNFIAGNGLQDHLSTHAPHPTHAPNQGFTGPVPGPEFNAGGGFSNGGGFGSLGPQHHQPIQNHQGPPAGPGPQFGPGGNEGQGPQGPPAGPGGQNQGQGFVPGPGFFGPPGGGPSGSPSGIAGDGGDHNPNPPPAGPHFHPKQPGHGPGPGFHGKVSPLKKGLGLLRLLLGGKHGGHIGGHHPPGPIGVGGGKPGLGITAGIKGNVGLTVQGPGLGGPGPAHGPGPHGHGAGTGLGLKDKDKLALKHKLKLPLGKVLKIVVTVIQKWLDFYAKFSIPKDHYLRVISFAGVYLLFAWLFKDSEHLLHPKCEAWGWGGPEEFTFHAPARFVPAVPVDQKMQREFLELFRGIEDCHDGKCDKKKKKKNKKKKNKRNKHKGHGNGNNNGNGKNKKDRSSEEDDEDYEDDDPSAEDDHDEMMESYQMEINYINDMCPRDQFFYSMSPYHIEAWTTLQRMFVAQKTPADVLHLARALLHSRSVNPKVWYLGLLAASVERPDMTGFSLAHPLDAMPDLFVPGHLIDDEFRRYRGIALKSRQKRQFIISPSSHLLVPREFNGTTILVHAHHRADRYITSSNSTTTTTTRAPITSRTTTTTSRPTATSRTTTTTSTTTMSPVLMEKGRIPPVGSKNVTKAAFGKSIEVEQRDQDQDESEESSEDEEEDEEVDGSSGDSGSEERVSTHKKKHPLGYGFGKIGDGYGGYKRGPGQGLQFNGGNKGDGGDDDDDDDKKKDKHKGHGKKKGKGKKGKGKKKKCIIVDGSVGLDNGVENKLWYWREDMMLNQHHAYWHQVYAINATRHGDRRAELFFYMHRSMLARYNAERLSNGFHRTAELGLYPGAIIEEGYDAHIKDFNSGRWWTPRAPHVPMQDILHIHDPDYARDIIITDVIGLYNKFVKAIKTGKLLTADGKFLPIRFHEGLQPLANTIEASNLSVNPFYYDAFGLHNLGHLLVGLASDPDWSKKLPSGVMSEAAVSMRDPAFYTYHTILDNLFEKFKQTLPPYKPYGGVWPLQWHGVDVVDVKVISHGGISEHNHLTTFYIKHKFQLEPGVDRSVEKGIEKAEICAVHLDHAPFQFQITIDRKKCAKSKSGQGTVRIFMAPRYNEEGERLSYGEQRRLMFQMDAFQVDLHVGRNVITRNSRDNQLTKPWSRSLKDYERGPDPSGAADFCGCGWPTHLYIPKGNTKGMPFDIFVMVTNFDEDAVVDHPLDLEVPETCNSPYIFCGRPRRRYPDARPMGYPFDRPGYHVPAKACGSGLTIKDLLCKIAGKIFTRPVATLEEFVSGASNMAMTVVEVKHIPKVIGKHHG